MSWFGEVEETVRGFGREGVGVASYRMVLAETEQTRLGIESNRLGGPYAPISGSDLSGGSFLIQWTDGLVSRGSLSRSPKSALEEVLASAFEGRYDDEEEANFPGEQDVPDVPLYSEDAARVAGGEEPEVLPAILTRLRGVKDRHGAKLLDASARATRTRRRVVSSGGFRAETRTTSFGFHVALDSLVWDAHTDRRSFDPDEVERRAERTASDFEGLRGEAGEPPRGRTTVVLHPRVAEGFLRAFLMGNLSGGAVANGRSRFTADDFRAGREVFRADLTVACRPLVPMSVGSFRFTEEGVPARDLDLVREGRLVTPTLGLKYARRLDMEPAPAPAAMEGFAISMGDRLGRDEALAEGRVVLVHSVMGMHTQDTVRGEYSLLAPQCVLYEGGAEKGRIGATLNGSFFEDLRDPSVALVTFEGFACPGMRLSVELS